MKRMLRNIGELFALWIVVATIALIAIWLVVPKIFDAPTDERPTPLQSTAARTA
ncbi:MULTISPECIES: hypothetical protein [Burkholderia]|uniref:hypothetical protein n=1 Tax=Burkholderia TaxID=32008 RepID=UPI000DC2AC34|nr:MULTISPECIES: hypothetical protein [Burkholderia]MDP9550196.1 hypothetical protein [Burkholderia cepacia]MBR8393380.1 hypothetical protein [Burkholderia cenocepacia]MBR8473915.1 hypothetical protein [Burkholderia cenocepacia]MBR8491744.1 hypothetical protein [Burkholderia cenocepacia]MDO5919720.1 hypothetical protein [Burkholderia cenocepacia]